MGDKSQIQWTDATWNPVTGCAKVSPGCAHCYAETVANRFWHKQYPPVLAHPLPDQMRNSTAIAERDKAALEDAGGTRTRQFTDVLCHRDRLNQPLRWTRPRMVFVNSMSDLFHEDVPDAFIDEVFAAMALAPHHTFQVLTKRPDRMRAYLAGESRHLAVADAMEMPDWLPAGRRFPRLFENWPLPNVWLGVSVENQRFANERIPLLMKTPAAVRFVSAEPLLGAVTFRWGKWDRGLDADGRPRAVVNEFDSLRMLDWVIVGGESGPQSRPFDVEWARGIVRECQQAGVPVFVKQMGDLPTMAESAWRSGRETSTPILSYAKRKLGPAGSVVLAMSHKGSEPTEWPADLRVREFPKAVA